MLNLRSYAQILCLFDLKYFDYNGPQRMLSIIQNKHNNSSHNIFVNQNVYIIDHIFPWPVSVPTFFLDQSFLDMFFWDQIFFYLKILDPKKIFGPKFFRTQNIGPQTSLSLPVNCFMVTHCDTDHSCQNNTKTRSSCFYVKTHWFVFVTMLSL